MSVKLDLADRPSEDVTNACNINSIDLVADELYSLLDEVGSELIADEFTIGLHSDKHDFTNHVKTAVREGLDPSSSLVELEDKITIDDSLEHMSQSRFSELTNDRAVVAVVQLLFERLHTPQLSHQRGVQRKRLEWMTRHGVSSLLVPQSLNSHTRTCPRTRDRPRLVFLPIGSPQLNQIEPIWKGLKWESSRLTLIMEGTAEYRALLNEIFRKLTDQLSFVGSWIENHLDEFIQKSR